MPAATLELRGFSTERGRFLLTTASASSAVSPRVLERDLVDLQSWDRLLHHSSSSSSQQRLPTKRLRKLMASNWVRGDRAAGWRVELQKNVRACEDWINSAFAQLSTPQQLEFLDDGLYAAAKRKRAAARADSKHARDLQQYFTSAELVDLVLEQVKQRLDNQDDLVCFEQMRGTSSATRSTSGCTASPRRRFKSIAIVRRSCWATSCHRKARCLRTSSWWP